MSTFKNVMGKLARDEDGAALVEYGLLVALIAAVCLVAVQTLGLNINKVFKAIGDVIVPPPAG